MESKKNVPNTYSLDFKLKVLSDMCENGLSTFGVAKKYGIKTIRRYFIGFDNMF